MTCDDTDGFCDLAHATASIPLDDAACLFILVLVVDEFRCKMVFDNLHRNEASQGIIMAKSSRRGRLCFTAHVCSMPHGHTLSSTMPMRVSSTAILARGMRWAHAAKAAALKILST